MQGESFQGSGKRVPRNSFEHCPLLKFFPLVLRLAFAAGCWFAKVEGGGDQPRAISVWCLLRFDTNQRSSPPNRSASDRVWWFRASRGVRRGYAGRSAGEGGVEGLARSQHRGCE